MKKSTLQSCFVWALFCCLAVTGPVARAQFRDWTGLTSSIWADPANWNPIGSPLPNDTVRIGAGVPDAVVSLFTHETIAGLTMSGAATLLDVSAVWQPPYGIGNDSSLFVTGTTTLNNSSSFSGNLDTNNLLVGGSSTLIARNLDVRVLATVAGGAEMVLVGDANMRRSGSIGLNNNGSIRALKSASLSAPSGALLDLDGSAETGRVTVATLATTVGAGSLTIDGTLSDAFDGTIDLIYEPQFGPAGPVFTMVQPWAAGPNAVINLDQGTLSGGQFTSAGELNALSDSVIAAPTVFTGGSIRDAGGQFTFEGPVQFAAGNPIDVQANIHFLDTVEFNSADVSGGTYHVDEHASLQGNSNVVASRISAGSLSMSDGELTLSDGLSTEQLDLAGGTIRLNGRGGSLLDDVTFGGRGAPRFRIQAGHRVTAKQWRMTSDAQTIVAGGSEFEASQLHAERLVIGIAGRQDEDDQSILHVHTGGLVNVATADPATSGSVLIGADSYADGQLIVDGVAGDRRSTVQVEGGLFVGGGEPSVGVVHVANGGLVEVAGPMRLAPTAFIPRFSGDATVTVGGTQNNFPAELLVDDDIEFFAAKGTLNIHEGGRVEANKMILRSGGTLNLAGGELKLEVLDVLAGGAANLTDGYFDVDEVLGDVALEDVEVAPGDSPGTMDVVGSLTLRNTQLNIELGGTIAGEQYDRVDVTGPATLGGTLAVSLYDLGNGVFSPSAGDQFQIMSAAGGVLGQFDALVTPELPMGLTWGLDYEPASVTLSVLSAEPGDHDADGDVDSADLDRWEAEYGTHEVGGGAGLLAWQRHHAGQSAARLSTTAVPEPTSLALLALSLATMGAMTGRRFNVRR